MQTTGGCGNDFAGCAVAAAMDATNVVKSTSKNSKKQSTYQIKGAITNIEISASTYDNLMAKKPLCESITKQCVAVADQIGSMVMTAVYSSANNTCTLTTVTNMCSEASKIYETSSSNCSSGGGLVDIGGNGCIQGGGISVLGGGGSRTTTKSTFKGTFCEKYAEPVTTTTAIKM